MKKLLLISIWALLAPVSVYASDTDEGINASRDYDPAYGEAGDSLWQESFYKRYYPDIFEPRGDRDNDETDTSDDGPGRDNVPPYSPGESKKFKPAGDCHHLLINGVLVHEKE